MAVDQKYFQEESPCQKKLKVHTDERIGSFDGSYISHSGKICVRYEAETKAFTVETPVDAEVCFAGKTTIVQSGKYEFKCC